MMSEKALWCLLRRTPGPARLCVDPVAYEKCDGARVIYYNRLENGEIWLLTLYAESDCSTISAHELKMIKEVFDRSWEKEDECRGQ